MPNDNIKSYLHLHLIVFIWGFTAILGGLISLDALPLVWYRMMVALLLVFLFLLVRKRPIGASGKILAGFLLGGLVIALHWLTFFMAIKVSNISVTLACLSTGAFFASFLEPIFYGRKMIWYEVLFGLIVIVGLGIIFNVEGDHVQGIMLALTSAFLSALFSVINGKFAQKHEASVITFYELLGGVGFLTLYMLFSGYFTPSFFSLSLSDCIWLLVLGSICTAYAFLASVKVMKYLSPYTVMLTINLEPIYGIILAVLVFQDKEKMSPSFYVGAAIILLTVILNGVAKNYKKIKTN
ncbi:DMT family transporter [Flavobacterium sp.]|uniref:DMT family transporter n=1 Tax=Flavobacterium sp. TaxID=239 RepID=UPI00262B82F8|nr:DMT family transporter [Flavobacterium sp.]